MGKQFISPVSMVSTVCVVPGCVLCGKVNYLMIPFLCVLLALNFRSICCFVPPSVF